MNCLWRTCLLMDRDEMKSLYRRSSIDASYQVSVHLAQWFQRRRLKCEKLTDDELKTNNECKKMTRKARFTLRMLNLTKCR